MAKNSKMVSFIIFKQNLKTVFTLKYRDITENYNHNFNILNYFVITVSTLDIFLAELFKMKKNLFSFQNK